MQAPVDPELVTFGVYVVVVPVYLLLWHRHSRHCYAALAIAALILALCALLRSEPVRAWEPHLRHHQQVPTMERSPRGDIGLLADAGDRGCPGQARACLLLTQPLTLPVRKAGHATLPPGV